MSDLVLKGGEIFDGSGAAGYLGDLVIKDGLIADVAPSGTLSFSPDGGRYLASSGKDRRLCLWKKQQGDGETFYHLAAA